jgi:uncharacterized protein HemX
MSEQSENDLPPATLPQAKKKRRWLAWLILLLLLAGSGGLSYFLWQQLEQARRVSEHQASGGEARIQALQAQLNRLSEASERLSQDARGQIQALQAHQQRLERNIADLYARGRKVGDRDEQSLTETAYLLRIAQQRLSLGHDPQAAQAALEAADERLKSSQDPRLLPIREQLLKDLAQLQAVAWPDVGGAALRLSHYAGQVDALPLLQGRQQPESASPAPSRTDWDSLWAAVWGELKQLVVIRYNQGGGVELLAPEQRYFLAQNLRLKLESARFALLRHDSGEFQANLQQALAWLERYYDQNDGAVQAMRKALAEMRGMELAPALPDVSRALGLLDQLNSPALLPDNDERAAP